ncbi:toprim domain-containing protein [Methylocella sp.]|uniref:toprim domain-containing protein n=1 Tax=Methylocella sp. TaxID=1978226 RepID=UPI003782EEE8
MMLGPVAGAAIKIDADEDVTMGLTVGEGAETCVAARQLGLRPVWALGSAGAIGAFPVLPGVEALTILEELDDAGANGRAIEACASRWRAAGREVLIVSPLLGGDINDSIKPKNAG